MLLAVVYVVTMVGLIKANLREGKLGFISNGGLIVELGFISNEEELFQFNARYWSAAKAVAMILIKHEKALK